MSEYPSEQIEEKARALNLHSGSENCQAWWRGFEEMHVSRPKIVLATLQELSARKLTIPEFFLAYVYADSDNIGDILKYVDTVIAVVKDKRPLEKSDFFKVPGGKFVHGAASKTRAIPSYALTEWEFQMGDDEQKHYRQKSAALLTEGLVCAKEALKKLPDELFGRMSAIEARFFWADFVDRVAKEHNIFVFLSIVEALKRGGINLQALYDAYRDTDSTLFTEVIASRPAER